ncbi:MAG: hypothetical protein M0R49_01115 [Limnochordia bacterium]|jgi:hypothetical protein|nr:hypothetical protein [Limnochordia bacterium]
MSSDLEPVSQETIENWIALEEDTFLLRDFCTKRELNPASPTLTVTLNDLKRGRKLKHLGMGRYQKIKDIQPVNWLASPDEEPLPFLWPRQHKYGDSDFGLDGVIEIYRGDLIMIAGVGNAGKSCMALNTLANNLNLFDSKPVLMGNEYCSSNGEASPKFRRRLMNMDESKGGWVQWADEKGQSSFDLLPVLANWEDYVREDALNVIDWINLTDNHYLIGGILEKMKTRVGKGLIVAVIQKKEGSDKGRGGDFSQDLADVYLTINPLKDFTSRLTIGKVKAATTKVTGRHYAFSIVDNGACLKDIREVFPCGICGGRKTKWMQSLKREVECPSCLGWGYLSKKEE